MSFIEEQIDQMRERLKELEPAVREAELLSRSITALEKEKASSSKEVAPGAGRYENFMRVQEHLAVPIREKQIREALEADPEATNRKIGDQIGISGARVGQIRKGMDKNRPEGSPDP